MQRGYLYGHDCAVEMQQWYCCQQPNQLCIWITAEHVEGCLYWQFLNHVWEVSSNRKRYLLEGWPITPIGLDLLCNEFIADSQLVNRVLQALLEACGLLIELHTRALFHSFFSMHLLFRFIECSDHQFVELVIATATARQMLSDSWVCFI